MKNLATQIQLRLRLVFSLIFLLLIMAAFDESYSVATAQSSRLLLRFENNLNGEKGETPLVANGIFNFEQGRFGAGVNLISPNIFYPSKGNIDATEGVIECWIKPNWNGSPNGLPHSILRWGVGGGLAVYYDGAFLRILLNRFGVAPGGETGTGVSINNWVANEWHYVAFTWSNSRKKVQIFIDGNLVAENSFNFKLPLVLDDSFQIGKDTNLSNEGNLDAVLDDFQISNRLKTNQQIEESYLSSLPKYKNKSLFDEINKHRDFTLDD
jgi:hypothetical protein